MSLFDDTCRRRRWDKLRNAFRRASRGFWKRFRNPQTWKFIVWMGLIVYRLVRLILRVLELFE